MSTAVTTTVKQLAQQVNNEVKSRSAEESYPYTYRMLHATRTYQTLALIGCILGMLITIGLFFTLTFFSGMVCGLVNMSKSLSPNNPQNQINQQNY